MNRGYRRNFYTGGNNNYYYAPAPVYVPTPVYVPAPSYDNTYYTTDNSCTCNNVYYQDCNYSECAGISMDGAWTTTTTTDSSSTTTDSSSDGSTWTITIGRKLRQQGE